MSLIIKPKTGAFPANSGIPIGMSQPIPFINAELLSRVEKRLGVSALNLGIDIKRFLGFVNECVKRHLDYLDAEDAKLAAAKIDEENDSTNRQ